jgi:hypothetical protein
MMKTYSCIFGSVEARNEQSARRKLGKQLGCDPGPMQVDVLADAVEESPGCSCGWSGEGTGNNGQSMQGDKCPNCGTQLF